MTRRALAPAPLLLVLMAILVPAPAAPGGDGVPAALWEALTLSRPTPPFDAPAFELHGVDGRRLALAELRGRVVLLYFWATW